MPEVAGSSPVGRPISFICFQVTTASRNIITPLRNLIPLLIGGLSHARNLGLARF